MSNIVFIFCLIAELGCFEDFKAIYQAASLEDPKLISKDLVICSLGAEIVTESYSKASALYLFDRGESLVALTEVNLIMGGYSSNYLLSSFRKSGELIENKYIGSNALRESGGRQCTITIINDSLLQVQIDMVEYKGEDERILSSEFKHYLVVDTGFSQLGSVRYSSSRSFPQSSFRMLTLDELKNYSKEELDIMRNEIFADYGYKFKTEKWQKYFAKQPWYEPRSDDVNNQLSVVEKVNVQTILEISRTK